MEKNALVKQLDKYGKIWNVYTQKGSFKKYYLLVRTSKGFYTFGGWYSTIKEIRNYITSNNNLYV